MNIDSISQDVEFAYQKTSDCYTIIVFLQLQERDIIDIIFF